LTGEGGVGGADTAGVGFGEGGGGFVKVRSFLGEQVFVDSRVKIAALSFGEHHYYFVSNPVQVVEIVRLARWVINA
jgi:hypothetical protein